MGNKCLAGRLAFSCAVIQTINKCTICSYLDVSRLVLNVDSIASWEGFVALNFWISCGSEMTFHYFTHLCFSFSHDSGSKEILL